jgi:hypothetical protein
MEKKTCIVSMFGAPGAGKSTLSSYVFAKLKMMGVNCELVSEFAKDKVWENNNEALSNQIYIFAKQYYRISRCADKVDVIVTDSPLFLSPFYNKDPDIDAPLKELAFKIANKYNNLNYFIRRVKKYNPVGRLQTEAESNEYGIRIKDMLKSFNVDYKEIDGDLMSADIVVQDVIDMLNGPQLVH